mgnify:CR=1 FL=1
MRTLVPALSLVVLAGCNEYGIQPDSMLGPNARPDIEVSPDRVDFGSVSMLDEAWPTRTVEIRNVGEGLLNVSRIEVAAGPFSLVEDPGTLEIRPGDSRFVELRFDIVEPGKAEGVLDVWSDDPDEDLLHVPIAGRARGPWLVVDPPVHDFGPVPLACQKTLDVIVQNIGDEPLVVNEMSYTADLGFSATLAREVPFSLAAGEYTVATVDLQANVEGAITGELFVDSTDPRGPQTALQAAQPEGSRTRTDEFATPPDPPVDLIIAVDRSASMLDDAELLGASFNTFATTLGELTSNWRIGVVTLDSGCFNGGIITKSTPDYLGVFEKAVNTGDDRSIQDDEALFSLVDRALDNDVAGGCNAGFRRKGAALHVIVVSDEPERSTERSPSLTWDTFVERWYDEVEAPKLLKVSGVVDLEACGDGAYGYLQAIEATDGEPLSLCSADWTETAVTLAEATLERVHAFTLARRPVPGSIVILIDGVRSDVDYTYDAASNSVIIPAVAGGAHKIGVHYRVTEDCL